MIKKDDTLVCLVPGPDIEKPKEMTNSDKKDESETNYAITDSEKYI